MQPRHILIALVVALMWGGNFVVTKIALGEIPLFLLLCLRFIFLTFPLIFFIPRPKEVSWKHLFTLSSVLYIVKFGLVFGSLSVGLSPGIASLVLQTQALFTIVLSAFIFKTEVSQKQILGTVLSLSGMALIAFQEHVGGNILGVMLVFCGAIMWSISNILYRKAKDANAFALTIWMGIFPPIPFFLASLMWEGSHLMLSTLSHFSMKMFLCLGFIVVCASLIGSTCWAYLFKKYDASVVAPYALLIPVCSIAMSWLFLDEVYSVRTLGACGIVFAGLILNQWPGKIDKKISDDSSLKYSKKA